MAPKVIAIILGLSSVLAAIPMHSVQAQEYQGCFMVDSSGRAINLNSVCRSQQSSNNQKPIDVFAVATIYADTFCQARLDGYVGDVARAKAEDVHDVLLDGRTASSVPGLLDKEYDLIRKVCPQFVLR